MRIVHDIDCPMAPGVGWNGHRLDLHACTDSPQNHPGLPPQMFEDEEIYIEGDPEYLIPVLELWLNAAKGFVAKSNGSGGKAEQVKR